MDDSHPAKKLAIEIVKALEAHSNKDTSVVLTALSMTLASLAVEAGMEEEKAVYAFRKSFGEAQRRLKRVLKPTQH